VETSTTDEAPLTPENFNPRRQSGLTHTVSGDRTELIVKVKFKATGSHMVTMSTVSHMVTMDTGSHMVTMATGSHMVIMVTMASRGREVHHGCCASFSEGGGGGLPSGVFYRCTNMACSPQ
jgi:hypothetical protein